MHGLAGVKRPADTREVTRKDGRVIQRRPDTIFETDRLHE